MSRTGKLSFKPDLVTRYDLRDAYWQTQDPRFLQALRAFEDMQPKGAPGRRKTWSIEELLFLWVEVQLEKESGRAESDNGACKLLADGRGCPASTLQKRITEANKFVREQPQAAKQANVFLRQVRELRVARK